MRRLVCLVIAAGLTGCGHPQKWANSEVMCYNPGNRTCFATYDSGATVNYDLDQPGLYVRKNVVGK